MRKSSQSIMLILAFAFLANAIMVAAAKRAANITLPPGAVHIDPLDYTVVGSNYTDWRTNNSFSNFNPTGTAPPFIQVFDPSFLNVTGANANIRVISSNPGFAFAHEAPIYVPNLNAIFFCSKAGGPPTYAGWNNNSVVSMLNLTEVDHVVGNASSSLNIEVQTLNLSDTVQMVNGGTGPYHGGLLFVTSGRTALLPPSIVLVEPTPPYNTTVLLDNFFGRQFNSLNDVKVLPGTDLIFFTDDGYGYMGDFRPEPMLPQQVYSFDPSTGRVRVVADQFVQPNGIAFTPDGGTAFVTDTGLINMPGNNQTMPATIYQYDVDPVTRVFKNRRVFAYSDSGIPDGIQLDVNGNVYSGCGDGVQVWNPDGDLIGKFVTNTTTTELMFTKSGLLMFCDEVIYLADIQAQGMDLTTK